MISVQYYERYCTLLRGPLFSGHTVYVSVFTMTNKYDGALTYDYHYLVVKETRVV